MKKSHDFRIIIIDDNPQIHHDFLKILRNPADISDQIAKLEEKIFGEEELQGLLPNFQIDTTNQGEEGLAKIEEAIKSGNPYALAFVDIRMPPGWDGIETIKRIWALDKDIQIVICTAYSDYSWEETVVQLGKTDNLLILKKPFDNVAVRQIACALTHKWQLMKDARQYTKLLEKHVKERTSELNKSLSLVRATLESSNDGILVVNNEGKLIDFNNRFLLLWHLKKSTVVDNNFKNLLKQIMTEILDEDKFFKRINELDKNNEAIMIDVIKLKNGKIFEFYSQPQKLTNKIIGRVWSFRDITERALANRS